MYILEFLFVKFLFQGIPTLIIGNHILYGKIVDSDKPLLVMKNEKINLSNNLEINMIDKIDIDNDDDKSSISCLSCSSSH